MISDRTRLVAEVLGEKRRGRLHDLVAEIDWARARRLSPDEISSAVKNAGRPSVGRDVAKVMSDVAALKRKRGVIDDPRGASLDERQCRRHRRRCKI